MPVVVAHKDGKVREFNSKNQKSIESAKANGWAFEDAIVDHEVYGTTAIAGDTIGTQRDADQYSDKERWREKKEYNAAEKEEYSGAFDQVRTGLEGGVNALTFGGLDEIAKLGDDKDYFLRKKHSSMDEVGNIAGVVLPAIVSGGTSHLAKGAAKAGGKAAGKFAAKKGLKQSADDVLRWTGPGLANRLGAKAAGKFAAKEGAKRTAIHAAVESGAIAAGTALVATTIGDEPINGESILGQVGGAALFGGLLGGGIGALGGGAGKLLGKSKNVKAASIGKLRKEVVNEIETKLERTINTARQTSRAADDGATAFFPNNGSKAVQEAEQEYIESLGNRGVRELMDANPEEFAVVLNKLNRFGQVTEDFAKSADQVAYQNLVRMRSASKHSVGETMDLSGRRLADELGFKMDADVLPGSAADSLLRSYAVQNLNKSGSTLLKKVEERALVTANDYAEKAGIEGVKKGMMKKVMGAVSAVPVVGRLPSMVGGVLGPVSKLAKKSISAPGHIIAKNPKLVARSVTTAWANHHFYPERTTDKEMRQHIPEYKSSKKTHVTEAVRASIEINKAMNGREAMLERMQKQFMQLSQVSPITSRTVMDGAMQRIEFLQKKAMPVSAFQMPGQAPPSYSEVDAWEMLNYIEYTENPVKALEEFTRGEMTPEGAEVLKELYPDLTAKFLDDIMEEPEKLGNLTYEQKTQLAMLTGVVLDPSLDPMMIQSFQSTFAPQQEEQPQSGGQITRKIDLKPTRTQAELLATGTDL